MLQGPFRVPSFNGYVPRRLQPWIYLLFAQGKRIKLFIF